MTRRFLTPLSTDHVDFNLTNPSEWAEGRLWWDDEEGTLEIGHSASVIQSVGMEFYMPPVKNNSGEDIPNGSFVMATGAQGDRITIAKAVTDGSVDPEYMIGVATMTIVDGSETGLITTNGTVRDIDTSLWPVGTLLYPSSASAGVLTASADVSPAIATPIAIVLRQHAQTGRIYVRMKTSTKLDNVQDVNVEGVTNGQVLTYDGDTSTWGADSVPPSATAIGESFPESPSPGEFFFNSSTEKLYFFYGTWNEISFTKIPIDGGSSSTTEFLDAPLDGGDSEETAFADGTYDGGTSSTTY